MSQYLLIISPRVDVQADAGLTRVEGQGTGLSPHVPHLDHAVSTPGDQAVALVQSENSDNQFTINMTMSVT